jgi:hypothetical protein
MYDFLASVIGPQYLADMNCMDMVIRNRQTKRVTRRKLWPTEEVKISQDIGEMHRHHNRNLDRWLSQF